MVSVSKDQRNVNEFATFIHWGLTCPPWRVAHGYTSANGDPGALAAVAGSDCFRRLIAVTPGVADLSALHLRARRVCDKWLVHGTRSATAA